MKRYLACAGLIVCVAVGCWVAFWRDTAGPADTTTGAPGIDEAMPRSEVDLAEATISSDGLPAEVAIAGQSTATVGGSCAVQGRLRLDPEADFTPTSVLVKIVQVRPNGDSITANSASGKLKPVAGQDHVYQFTIVMKAPTKAGSYEILGRFRGKTFSAGRLDVSK